MAKLILSMDGLVLKEITLTKERTTIGRKPHNDIQIDNLAVSGEHAVIVTILNDSFLEDLGSTNGTLVNGQPIKKHFLQNNDVIELGKYKLKYMNESGASVGRSMDFEKTMVLRPGGAPRPEVPMGVSQPMAAPAAHQPPIHASQPMAMQTGAFAAVPQGAAAHMHDTVRGPASLGGMPGADASLPIPPSVALGAGALGPGALPAMPAAPDLNSSQGLAIMSEPPPSPPGFNGVNGPLGQTPTGGLPLGLSQPLQLAMLGTSQPQSLDAMRGQASPQAFAATRANPVYVEHTPPMTVSQSMQVRPGLAAVQILTGSNAGRELELVKPLTTLGKPQVQVAVITKRPNGYYITHVEGTTYPIVNGRGLDAQAHLLADHDIIEIAGVKMEFYFK
jgi:pSer/pThr/pTyr-binding forkhead associated (FHA) protein